MTSKDHYKGETSGTEPDVDASITDVQDTPQTTLQEVLSTVWANSLGIKEVSIDDNFFELGGASVVATQIVSRLRQMFQMDLPAVLLFDTPTIRTLARYMIEHEARPGLTEKTATLLKRIEGMSEEEVARGLRSK
jgi:acyl carrier protein